MTSTATRASMVEGTAAPGRGFRSGLWQKDIDVSPPSPEAVERACAAYRAEGLHAY